MENGKIGDMVEHGICEAYKVKSQVISASEAAEMILRVDDIVQCAPPARAMRAAPSGEGRGQELIPPSDLLPHLSGCALLQTCCRTSRAAHSFRLRCLRLVPSFRPLPHPSRALPTRIRRRVTFGFRAVRSRWVRAALWH